MGLRAFKTTFLVAIDEDEALANEQRDSENPVTIEELRTYLSDALRLSFNDEDFGNEVGVQSLQVLIENLEELPAAEVKRLYPTSA